MAEEKDSEESSLFCESFLYITGNSSIFYYIKTSGDRKDAAESNPTQEPNPAKPDSFIYCKKNQRFLKNVCAIIGIGIARVSLQVW